jgi:predicted RNA-binding Zn-ribbon protein involved in translation (DUF1610 family)
MQGQPCDNSNGDRLAADTMQSFKCAQCGNMYATSQSKCDICGFHCEESTCEILSSSTEDF